MKYLTLTDPEKVWKPDTFFRNEKTGHFHYILVNNVYVRKERDNSEFELMQIGGYTI
jgi:hypothetical protein